LDWSSFNLETTNLGRFDLCYNLELKRNTRKLNLFLLSSYKQINSGTTNRIAKMENNILRIDN